MKYCLRKILLMLLAALLSGYAFSQDNEAHTGVLNFYLDCYECDFDFVREQLPFVSFTRDPLAADVHILVTESNTGSGGEKFFLNFIGRNGLKGTDYEYNVTTIESDTDDEIRKALLQMLKIGILQYYSKTDFVNRLKLDIEESENRKADELIIDRWNKWVFSVQAGGDIQFEKSQSGMDLGTAFNARKIKEEWKTNLDAYYSSEQEKYTDDDSTITNKQHRTEMSAYFVKSLNEKWSAGVFATYTSMNYINTRNKTGAALGIEYNIFPWKECNRRVFAIQYWAGLNVIDYYERTIYDKLKETLFSEGLEVNLEMIQPWGEVRLGLEGRHYFHDFSKNRLSLESDFSVRITKNLSVFCELQTDIIHDQLYLSASELSRDDILLERRKLATTYEISSELGIRFTFGSIYNNIVNERF
jgi:hypothetical protein